MLTLETSDGVALALEQHGDSGPLLVLVHGGATDRHCFDRLLPFLSDYTVVRYDRRGHGESTGSATADVDREARDLEEVVAHLEGPALVLGYSYGAMVALRALTTTRPLPVRGAVLYEPPMAVDGILEGLEDVISLVNDERHDEAAALFVTQTFHLPGRVVEAMRRDPSWAVSVGHMPTMPAELEGLRSAVLPQPPVTAPPVRVLVAEQGGNPAFVQIAHHLAAVLPDADVVPVPGLPHFAMASAPEAFARAADEHFQRCS